MRLTIDLIQEADQTVDPNNDRALVLRGYKIAVIENLGITRDQYGCIDLSDNDIVKVANIPKLIRLRTLLLANNSLSRIASDAFDSLPELTSLVLSNNRIARLATLLPISNLTRLERLSLIENPVVREPHYRWFVIHLLRYSRSFRYLDFQRITDRERADAKAFFESPEGVAMLVAVVPEQLVEEPTVPHGVAKVERKFAISQQILMQIKIAITEASDMDVVNKLERALKTGDITDEVAKIIGLS